MAIFGNMQDSQTFAKGASNAQVSRIWREWPFLIIASFSKKIFLKSSNFLRNDFPTFLFTWIRSVDGVPDLELILMIFGQLIELVPQQNVVFSLKEKVLTSFRKKQAVFFIYFNFNESLF
jgi:hypothetical protein